MSGSPPSAPVVSAPEALGDLLPAETWLILLVLAGVAALAWLAAAGLGALVARLAPAGGVLADVVRRGRRPVRLLVVLLAVSGALDAATGAGGWRDPVLRFLGPALIAAVAWLVAVAVHSAGDVLLARYDVDVVDNRHARRVRTQVSLLRRLAVVAVGVLAGAAMLLTFPGARAAGASILASAGVISIVAGLAAQTSLANVFAGLQLAFTDAIRVDDVVVLEGEWGRIEEITLTYVVVHIWDDRRLVLPSTWFTTNPFQNWTRRESAVLGAVEFDVDWTTPFDRMRVELDRLLAGSRLWDRRVGVLQVTDAVGAMVRVRVLVSAHDGPTLFDLRCQVREGLVVWLQREHEYALPRFRHEGRAGARPASAPRPELAAARPAGLFTGSAAGVERGRAFTGPTEDGADVPDRGHTPAGRSPAAAPAG